MSTLPPEPPPDEAPTKGGYRFIAPSLDAAEPYLLSLGLHHREVVTRESDLFGFDPKITTLILADRHVLESCDTNLLFRVNRMHGMGARVLTFPEALLERRTYVRRRGL